jgi:hypothetical protein
MRFRRSPAEDHGADEQPRSDTLTVDRSAVSEIAHGDLALLDPIGVEQLDDVIEAMNLPAGAQAVDIGCGRGEALVRIWERWAACGTGIDLYAPYIEDARRAAQRRVPTGGVRFEVADARSHPFPPEQCDLAMAIGATHALGGDWRDAIRALAGLVHPRGGLVLLGEGFWRQEPLEPYLEALGATEDELPDHFTLVEFAAQEGLDLIASAMTTDEEWERYERTLIDNGERWADAHPDHELASEMRSYVQAARDRLDGPGGRDTLGFGLFLFARPG